MTFDIKPYFAENPVVAADYAGTGRVFSLVSGQPSGMSIGGASSSGATWGVISYPAPRAVSVYNLSVRCVDCPDANNANGIGIYNQTFWYSVFGVSNRGWAAGYAYDTNSKSVTALVNTTYTSSTYEMLLVPYSGQNWFSPNNWRDLVAGTANIGAQTFNRRINTTPSFAGGIDVATGTWTLAIRDKALPTDIVVFQLVLTAANTELVITAGNQPPTIPAFTIPTATVNVAYSFQFPIATDPEGQAITYFLNGSIPSGLSWNGTTRTLSGTPTTAQTQSFVYQATDGVNTTSAPAQNLTVNAPANNNAAPVLPDFTFPVAQVGLPYYFQLPNATDSDGPNALVYTLSGTLPTGLFYTELNGIRRIHGTPRGATGSVVSLTWSVTDGITPVSRVKPFTAQGCSDYRELTELAGLTSQVVWEYRRDGDTNNPISADGAWRVRRFQSLVEVHQQGSGSFDFLKVTNNSFAIGNRVSGGNNADFVVAGSPNPSLYPSEAGYVITTNPYTASNVAQTFNWARVDSCGYIVETGTYVVASGNQTVQKTTSTNAGKIDLSATVVNGRVVISNNVNPGGGVYRINGDGAAPLSRTDLSGTFPLDRPIGVEWFATNTPSDSNQSALQFIAIFTS